MQNWSRDEVVRLVKIWNLGFRAEDVVKSFPNRTRNAILGKLFRLRLDKATARLIKRPLATYRSHKTTKYRIRKNDRDSKNDAFGRQD